MASVDARILPANALLQRYATAGGGYTDCFETRLDGAFTLAAFVETFYVSPLFRLERWILAKLLGKPSTDAQALAVAQGSGDRFAVWRVEDRGPDQLLMCDDAGRTRSWFMVLPETHDGRPSTRLLFGSAVLPKRNQSGDSPGMGVLFHALLGFHKLYSRALLSSARRALLRR